MEERAVQFFNEGHNCAQCLLMAAGEADAARLCAGLGRGLGYGGLCGAVIAGAMLVGDQNARQRVLVLLTEFYGRFGGLDCAAARREDCEMIIRAAAELVEMIKTYAD